MDKLILLAIYLLILISIPLFEVLIKNYIRRNYYEKHHFPKTKNNIKLYYLKNEGIMFGGLSKKRTTLIIITIIGLIVAIGVSVYTWFFIEGFYFVKITLAFLASGSLSNSLERFIYKYVIDYFGFPNAPIKRLRNVVFNLADIMIFFGTFVLYLYMIYLVIETIV